MLFLNFQEEGYCHPLDSKVLKQALRLIYIIVQVNS
jgi:hypothetical protein